MENFFGSIFKNLGIIVTIISVSFVYLLGWLIFMRGRKVIRISKLTIPKDLLDDGLTEEILLNRLKNSLYDSVHNLHVREKKDKWTYLYMPFKQVFSLDSGKATFEVSASNDFWRPILVIISSMFYKISSISFELSFQKINDSENTHSYKIYYNAERIKRGTFDVQNEIKTSFRDLIAEISSFLIAQVSPPCYLQSIEILKASTKDSNQTITDIDPLIAQITNKLLLGAKDYCCEECKRKIGSSKFLRKCNRLQGYMMTPISVKYLYLVDKLDNNQECLKSDNYFYRQLEYMKGAFEAFKNSKSLFYRLRYNAKFENRRKWLCFFAARVKHTWFENMAYKELLKLQDALTGESEKAFNYTSFLTMINNRFNENYSCYKSGLNKIYYANVTKKNNESRFNFIFSKR